MNLINDPLWYAVPNILEGKNQKSLFDLDEHPCKGRHSVSKFYVFLQNPDICFEVISLTTGSTTKKQTPDKFHLKSAIQSLCYS